MLTKYKPVIAMSYFVMLSLMMEAQEKDPVADSLLIQLNRSKEDSNKVKLYMELGNNVGYYDPKRALDYALAGLTLSRKINYTTGIGRTTYLAGNTYLDLGDYPKSAEMLNESEKIFTSLKREDMIGMINVARGNSYYMQSDLWNASFHYSKATEIFHKLKDTVREIISYQNLIATLGEVKNYEKAITLSEKLLLILRPRNDTSQIAHALNHIILNYTALNKMREAAEHIPELLGIIENSLDYNLASDSYNVIGDFYFRKESYDSAISFYKKALTRSLKNNYQPAQYNLGIGSAYLKKENLTEAFRFLTTAITQARESNSRDIYFRACLPMSEYYRKTNNSQRAYYYLQEYTKLNDSILVADTRQYTTHLEAVFENSKKENEILRLKTEELGKTLAIKKRNTYLIIAGALLLLVIIYFLLKSREAANRRRILEQEKIIKEERITSLEKEQQVISLQSMITGQESERSRIARDLHDGLGGLFSTIKMYFSTLKHERPELEKDPLFTRSFDLADNASVEMRRIAHNLMPEVLIKLGLVNAVQDLCNNINAGKLLKISLQSYGMEERLNANMEIMLYRIIQELMNNIIKHARATEVIIQFNRHADCLTVTVEDNGRGFNLNDTGTVTAGINTIRSRVNYLNGQLNIDSKTGVGTTVIMEFLLSSDPVTEPL